MQTIYADLNEIVFEDRHRLYGAYPIRKVKERSTLMAALIALLTFAFVAVLPWMWSVLTWATPLILKEEPDELLTEIPIMELPDIPEVEEIPIVETPPPPIRTQEFKIPEPTPEEELDQEETVVEQAELTETPDLTTVDDPTLGEFDWSTVRDEPPAVTEVKEDSIPDHTKFILVEQEPAPVNLDEVKKLIGYPPVAKEIELEGKVFMRILVDKNGSVMKYIVQNADAAHPILVKAVAEKLNHLVFTPGISGGKPVRVWVTIPFKFTLENSR